MTIDLNDLISRKRIRFELGESTMPKKYKDFCLRVIDDKSLTPTIDINTPKEDLRNWIVDNWETAVFDCIGLALSTMVVDAKKDMNDVVDREETADFISERVKTGILNVLDTYDVEIPKSLKVIEYEGRYHGRDFYICKCPVCGCHLDGNQVQKYCHECGQRLEWEK